MTSGGDLFPPSERVIYGKAPLSQVICQVRYPQILRIDSQPPADFQERIRRIFPLVERQRVDLANVRPDILQMMGLAAGSNVLFRTEDRQHTVMLGSESLAYST